MYMIITITKEVTKQLEQAYNIQKDRSLTES